MTDHILGNDQTRTATWTWAYNSSTDQPARNGTAPDSDTTNPRLVNGLIVLCLLVLNLAGNSVVVYVYHFRVKTSVFTFFVISLAVLDILTALTTMLLDTIIKVRPLQEDVLNLTILCKITHFQVYATSLMSGCVLTLIAYQRYRKICHPLKPSLTLGSAKKSFLIIVVCCLVVSSCTLVFNGPKDIPVLVDDHQQVVNITICRYDKQYEGTIYQTVFSTMLVAAFALVLCLTVVFYGLVSKSLHRFERQTSQLCAGSPVCTDIDSINKEQGFSEDSGELRRKHYQQSLQKSRMSVMSVGGNSERITTQMYRVFAVITFVFIISYLPHLIVLILNKSLNWDSKVMTKTQQFLLDLAYNCPYISTVSNPVIYGFRSAEFREHCKSIFTCRRWRRRRAYTR